MKKIYLDTETTGLTPGSIAQLSMIIEEDSGDISTKNYFFDIDYISEGAEQACGRGLDFYKKASQGLKFSNYRDELQQILTGATLIAHNEKFDENFICTEFWRLGVMFKPADRFCTMEYFKEILKIPGKGRYKYKNPKLEELINSFDIDTTKVKAYSDKLFGVTESSQYGFHDARYDTTAMFVAFQIYKESLRNQTSWKDVFTKGGYNGQAI